MEKQYMIQQIQTELPRIVALKNDLAAFKSDHANHQIRAAESLVATAAQNLVHAVDALAAAKYMEEAAGYRDGIQKAEGVEYYRSCSYALGYRRGLKDRKSLLEGRKTEGSMGGYDGTAS